jgi:D-serine deaminase-like pyridoxal phosphate-dependent protein
VPIDQGARGNSSVAEIAHRNVCDVRFQSSGSFCQCHKRSPARKELMTIHELDTPVLLIDANVLHRNLRKMAAYCDRHKLALRPHIKTHKMPEIAKLQLQYGATGITVAKLGEADVMADAGIDDILIVYPLWGDRKWARLADLANRARVSVAVDSLAAATGISQTAKAAGKEIGIRAEFDTGFHRCGWPITAESVLEIEKMMALPGLRWDGILLYPGHIMGDRLIREQDIKHENETMDALFDFLNSASIPYPMVSGGNTPAAFVSHRFHGLTESVRAHTYLMIAIRWMRNRQTLQIVL